MSTAATFALPFKISHPIRDIGIPLLAFIATISLPKIWLVYAYVVLGQAHFFMAYMYQFRGKRMNTWYFLTAGILFLIAVGYFTFFGELMAPLYLVAAIVFAAHFGLDEITLHGGKTGRVELTTVIGFVLLFVAFVLPDALPHIPALAAVPVIVAPLIVGAALIRLVLGPAVGEGERYLWYMGALTIFFGFVFSLAVYALAVVVILHTFNWMVGYGERMRGKGAKEVRYWIETVVTFSVSLALFTIFLLLEADILKYFFAVIYYDCWAIAHIVLSYRLPGRA